MKSKIQQPVELLAPCGSWESLQAAIKAGCSSVYFGIEQLNMRARSGINFTVEDIGKMAAIATEANIKTYITLNTVLYDHDLVMMRSIIEAAKLYGINGIIAADHAVMSYAKKKNVSVHISTQANISNIETVEFYSHFADVMVMARELTLEQVKEITHEILRRKITGPSGELVRVEIFVHGALCMAVSGKCYLSLHTHYASANRGACIQNCRRSYIVKDKDEDIEFEVDNEYIMSAKDLCTIEFLDKILDSGVSGLKIEGRGRSEDYVYTTVKCYQEAIQAVEKGVFSAAKVDEWKTQLATVYNRGFWDGYYLGKKMGEWSNEYGSKATKKRIYLGKGLNYFSKVGIGEFVMESYSLEVGDEILISGPTTGLIRDQVSEIRIEKLSRKNAKKGDLISIPVKEKIRARDKLYKIVDA